MNEPTLGRYRHYKGNEYTVLGLARHSETLEELVIYRQEYGEHGLWVRPKQMFLESVDINGRCVPRFQRVDASASDNVFQNLPKSLPQELVQTLLHAENLRIERIVSHGHASPDGFWYDQDQAEWVIVLTGAARLRIDDALLEMKPGDFVNIPAHKKHRVEWTSPGEPTVWLAVHYGERC
jgi:cupin 2 domain-containing protein